MTTLRIIHLLKTSFFKQIFGIWFGRNKMNRYFVEKHSDWTGFIRWKGLNVKKRNGMVVYRKKNKEDYFVSTKQ